MLKNRIIPVLLIKNSSLVKTIKYDNSRIVGDAFSMAKIFSNRMSDEMLILDIEASIKKSINSSLFKKIAKYCNMPLTIGGGLLNINNAKELFDSGADKIVICSSFFNNPNLVSDISKIYGKQSIVFSLDVLKKNNNYFVTSSSGNIIHDYTIENIIQKIEMYGAGEILLNSIDREGTMKGYDLNLLSIVKKCTNIPVIINGGCGSKFHCYQAIDNGANAIGIGSLFYWMGESIISIKEYLYKKNCNIRFL